MEIRHSHLVQRHELSSEETEDYGLDATGRSGLTAWGEAEMIVFGRRREGGRGCGGTAVTIDRGRRQARELALAIYDEQHYADLSLAIVAADTPEAVGDVVWEVRRVQSFQPRPASLRTQNVFENVLGDRVAPRSSGFLAHLQHSS